MPATVLNKLARMRGRHYPRQLPHGANGEGPVRVDGIGTFGVQCVGSAKYSGIEVTLMLDGADEVEPGMLRYHPEIGDDLDVRWVLDLATLDYGDHDGSRFGASIWEAAQAVADGMAARAPIAWAFDVALAAETELKDIDRSLQSLRVWLAGLNGQIAEEGDDETRTKMLARRTRLRAAMATAQDRSDGRGLALRTMLRAWHEYSGLPHDQRTEHVADVFARALRNPVAEPARRYHSYA